MHSSGGGPLVAMSRLTQAAMSHGTFAAPYGRLPFTIRKGGVSRALNAKFASRSMSAKRKNTPGRLWLEMLNLNVKVISNAHVARSMKPSTYAATPFCSAAMGSPCASSRRSSAAGGHATCGRENFTPT